MPQVTSVEPQKKKKERFNVFIDGKFAFGVDAETVLEYRINTGKNLSEKTVDSIIKNEQVSKLMDSCLRFLSYRPRSQKEVEDYLAKKISQREDIKFSQAKESNLIAEIIAKLQKYKYINDLEFAKWWIESRSKSSPRGKRVLKLELIIKGIDKELVEELLDELPDQAGLAKKALVKKIKKWHKLSPIEFKKKLYLYLSSRGFDFDTIKEVVAFFEKKR